MSADLNAKETGSFDHIIGQVLANRYLIERRLGEGAMGAVYRAKHVKVGRPFAVKVLHPRLLEDKKLLQRFEREAELAGRLRHPNVIGVVDVGETDEGMRYMVMEFAEGPDLATLLGEAPFTPQRIIHLTRQMLEGLFHAHEAGLIHRDFKPENVIIEKDTHGAEVPRIVDFGIAILRDGGDSTDAAGRLTTNGLVLGTPHYMAPEQAVADPIDHRIDLFALGIMIYEMLCGKLPFDGNGAEVARANLLLDPPPIKDRVPMLEVDPLLEAFARRLMLKKRDQRPATAKAARELLDLIARDRPAAAKELGISLDAATRGPQVTQDVQPVRRPSGEGTFPPPMREAPMSHPVTTAIPKKRKAPMIAAVVVGLGILGAAAVVLLNRSDDRAAPIAQPTVQQQPPPTEPKPIQQAQQQPPVEQPKPQEPIEQPVEEPAVEPKKKTAKRETKVTAKVAPQTKPHSTTSATQPAETKPAETKAVEAKPTETKAAPKSVDAKALEAQWLAVGQDVRSLPTGPDTEALKTRYRVFKLYDYYGSQAKLDEGAAILKQLAKDVAAAKR